MLSFRTIVCSVDFSEHSRAALSLAIARAQRFGARLIIVTVSEPLLVNSAAAAYDMDFVRKELFPELRDFVQKTAKARASEMPAWDVVVLVGEPASEIRVGTARGRRSHCHRHSWPQRLSQMVVGLYDRKGPASDNCARACGTTA